MLLENEKMPHKILS